MKISFNPSNSNKNILDLIKNNKDIIFDLKGHSIFTRGVEFKGTDTNTWRDIKINNVSIGSHTLDLRNGSNTTLTNTNGVVTINSTWRPVVDNLTSDSTTSSLSAKQGKVLKALIDGKSNSDHNHDEKYLKLTGGTMLGALNFANNTWNLVGNNSYIGDCNISGHFGIKAANTTYSGITFFNNASTFLGNLTAYSDNIKYGAYSLQFLDNGNTSVSASTWTNPFNDYNSNAVADGQAICVWGQSSYLSNLSTDTGDISLWLKRINANGASLNMVIDGDYYANGNQKVWNAGNDGSGSGLDADTLDGEHASSFVRAGHYESNDLNKLDTYSFIRSVNSNVSSTSPKGNTGWYNVIQLVHKNGASDGPGYIGQIALGMTTNTNDMFFRGKRTDPWKTVIHSDNIGNQTVANAYHLCINAANTWSTWYWAGQNGQPSWLWGSNDGTSMCVWNPSNFNVNTAQYLRSLGNQNCQTGRTQAYGDVYSYNTGTSNTGSPTIYSSVIGFGKGTGGTVEIAGGWCNTHLYWRSLRDCCEDWFPWRTVLDSSNYTEFMDNYYWANARKLINWYSARPTSLNAQFGDGSLRIFYATSSTTEGKPAEDSHILHLAWDNTDGWDAQLAVHIRSGKVSTRAQNGGTWQPWKTLAFTTDIPSSLKNPYSFNVFGVVYDGSAAKTVTTSTFISQVTEDTSTITDGTMLITSYASNSGFADTNSVNVPYKRKAIHLWEYIKAKTDSLYATKEHNHDEKYLKLTGGTMLGALNFANNTWNLVGNNSYIGDCNISGHFGIKAANTTYSGITFFNNASTFLGNLTAYSDNIKYGAYSLQFLDNGNTSVSASTWTNPFNDYNSNAVADGQAICVWGQSSYLSNLSTDTGDISLWLKRINANGASLNMVIDGDYYANGNQKVWNAGNDGSGSGLDADTLDGEHASSFVRAGHYESNDLNKLDTYSFIRSVNSNVSSTSPKGNTGWYNVIQLVHKNGASDGPGYIGQIALGMTTNTNDMFFRGKRTDPWKTVIHSDNIGNQTVANAYHLCINAANTWSTWYWAGQNGQPSWLWGSNDGTSMCVWNPSNFNVNTAQYLRSLGNQNCQTGRTQAYGDVYSYNTGTSNTGSPTIYSSVIGFGKGTGGTVEIAGGWCNTHLYWRSLRDCCEDWFPWRTVLDSSNYTEFMDNYYWANIKISTSSSTTTSPTVSNLTATNSISSGDIYLEHTNEINSRSNLYINYRSSFDVYVCQGGGNVCIGALRPTQKLDVRGNIITKGLGIQPCYLSRSALSTISPGDGYTYKCLEIGATTEISCIIADKAGSMRERGILIKFNRGYDGQIILLKDLENYGSGNGYFWVMPSGCRIIKADSSDTLINYNQINGIYNDGRSRFFVFSSVYSVWIEFLCT